MSPTTTTTEPVVVYDSFMECQPRGRGWNPMGIAVFATPADRAAAILELEAQGFQYMVTYWDTQGPGLSWCFRPGRRVSLKRLDRLPSVQRARRETRARDRFQASLYRNPAYDPVNQPRREPRYA